MRENPSVQWRPLWGILGTVSPGRLNTWRPNIHVAVSFRCNFNEINVRVHSQMPGKLMSKTHEVMNAGCEGHSDP